MGHVIRSTRRLGGALVALALGTVVLGACTAGAGSTPGPMRADGAWARPSMGMDRAGAVYLTVINETGRDDALVGVSSDAATTAELHETTKDAGGAMAMHPVHRIPIGSGGRAELGPGGLHVMLVGLAKPLVAGDTVVVTLRFEHAPELVVEATVRAG